MAIQIANVILARTLKPLTQVLSGAVSLEKYQTAAIEDENIFFFNNTSNSNLLKFKHAWKTGGVGKGKTEQVVLEIIDPSFEFERLFASTRFNDLLPKGYKSTSEQSDKRNEQLAQTIENYTNELKDSTLYSIANSVQDFNKKNESSLTLWAAYGIGDNVDHWSAPMRLEFTQAEVSYNNQGSRILTLYFVTFINLRRDTTNSIFGPVDSLEANIKATSNLRYEAKKVKVAPLPDQNRTFGIYDPIVNQSEWANEITKIRSATEIFQEVIKDYLSKVYSVTKDRIIIMYPKIESMFSELLKRNARSFLRKQEGETLPELDTLPVYQESIILKWFFEYLNFTINTEGTVDEPTNPAEVALKSRQESVIRTEGDPFEQNRRFTRRAANSNFRLEINTTTDNSTFEKIIETLERNSVLDTDIIIHQQTNPNIISVLEKFSLIDSSLLNDPQPVVIFGDSNLIRKYIYADVELLGIDESNKYFQDLPDNLKSVLNNKDYYREMILARPDIIQSNHVPSNFFSPVDESSAEIINKSRLPVFRYGTENPNVLKLDLNINKVLTAAYREIPVLSENNRVSWGTGDFVQSLTNRFKSYTREGGIGDTAKLKTFITSVLQEAVEGKIIESGLATDIDALNTTDDDKFLEILAKIHENVTRSSPASFRVLNELSGDSALAHTIRMLSAIFSQSFTGSVTTLPMFWLSNPSLISSNCFLFSLQPLMVGTQTTSPIQAIYTGVYTFVGFTHTISANAVESQFELVKHLQNTTDQELEEVTELTSSVVDPDILNLAIESDPAFKYLLEGGNEDNRLRESGGN